MRENEQPPALTNPATTQALSPPTTQDDPVPAIVAAIEAILAQPADDRAGWLLTVLEGVDGGSDPRAANAMLLRIGLAICDRMRLGGW